MRTDSLVRTPNDATTVIGACPTRHHTLSLYGMEATRQSPEGAPLQKAACRERGYVVRGSDVLDHFRLVARPLLLRPYEL
jgi:hypothetical protein